MIKVLRYNKEIIVKDDYSTLCSFDCDEKWRVDAIASKGLIVKDNKNQTRLVLSQPFIFINYMEEEEIEELDLAEYAKVHLGETKKGRTIIGYSELYGLIVSCKDGWSIESNRFNSDTYLREGYNRSLYMKIKDWEEL